MLSAGLMKLVSAMLGTAKSQPGTERLQVSFCLLQPTEKLFSYVCFSGWSVGHTETGVWL